MNRLEEILSKFNTSNNILKYTTHSWDFGAGEKPFETIDEFLILVKEEFDTFSDELKLLSPNLYKKMYAFLFDNQYSSWGQNNISFSWSSPSLKSYTECDSKPSSYVLEKEYRKVIENRSIDRFGDVKNIFKHEIELRTETKDIKKLFRKNKNGVKVKIIGLNIFDKYEDVEYLGLIINNIFSTYRVNNVDKVIVEEAGNSIILQPFENDERFEDKIIFTDTKLVTVCNIRYGINQVIFEY